MATAEPTMTSLRLHPDEEVVRSVLLSAFWTFGLYITTLGLWAIWRPRHRFILTNQRVVLVKGIVSKTETSIPLDRLQDASLLRSPVIGSRVSLSSAGGPLGFTNVGPLTQATALDFYDALMAQMADHRKTAGGT